MPTTRKTTGNEMPQGSSNWDEKEVKEALKQIDEGDYGLDEKDYMGELEWNTSDY
jgi:hypothetical protein